jgi:hypothetical protein
MPMPNWCSNLVTIHAKPDVIKRIKNALEREELFNEFFPMPKELENTSAPRDTPNWYDWRKANWGVKWDVCAPAVIEESETHITFYFDTAWMPATTFYGRLIESGEVEELAASYFEPGNCFAGVYDNGSEIDVSLIDFSSYVDFLSKSNMGSAVSAYPWLDENIRWFFEEWLETDEDDVQENDASL